MVKRKVGIMAGQSNSLDVALAPAWEDLHQEIAIRSPQTSLAELPTFSGGTYRDLFTMPVTFGGGPQVDALGDTINGQWQQVSLRGVAMAQVEYLTHYWATPSFLTFNATTIDYPGTAAVVGGSTASRLQTTLLWQGAGGNTEVTAIDAGTETLTSTAHGLSLGDVVAFNLSGSGAAWPTMAAGSPTFDSDSSYEVVTTPTADTFTVKTWPHGVALDFSSGTFTGTLRVYRAEQGTIRRRKTGTTHTVASGAPVSVGSVSGYILNVSPPFDPLPEVNERFTYQIVSGANSAAADEVVLRNRFGGIHDIGLGDITSTFCSLRREPSGKARINCQSIPVYVGRPIVFSEVITSGTALTALGLSSAIQYYVARLAEPGETRVATALDTGTDRITVPGHTFVANERVQLSTTGTLPGGTAAATDYWVIVIDANTIELSATSGGGTLDLTSTGTGALLIERPESYTAFYISATPGGEEIRLQADLELTIPTTLPTCAMQPVFNGSLTGLVLRCTSGTNVGESRPLAHVSYDAPNDLSIVHLSEAFTSTPQAGDVYEIEPPEVDGVDPVPFEEFALFLPWSPLEGRAEGLGAQSIVTMVTSGAQITITGQPAYVGARVKFYETTGAGRLPKPLVEGKPYFVTAAEGGSIFISETYGGTNIVGVGGDVGSGTFSCNIHEEEGRNNPYPPGFNYPNHMYTPILSMPFRGSKTVLLPSMAHHVGTALRCSQTLGEKVNVVVCAVGGTSIAHRELVPNGPGGAGLFWFDVRQQTSWAPGEDNNLFGRFLAELRSGNYAAKAAGYELETFGVFWPQGEADATKEANARLYGTNLRTLKKAMRQAIKDAGWWPDDPATIPWVHPLIKSTPWAYADIVNAAIKAEAELDPYMRWFEVDDLTTMPDGVHYDGAGQTVFEERAHDAWRTIYETGGEAVVVEVCNMALANLGEVADVTSIAPPDDTSQARLCAQFYPIARDAMLEQHAWDFTTRLLSTLTSRTNTRSEWTYAFDLPDTVLRVLSIRLPAERCDIDSEHFTVEVDTNGDRVLHTNISDPQMRYSSRIVDPSKFSTHFKRALSWKLAEMLAGPIIKGDKGAEMARMSAGMAMRLVAEARAHDSNAKRHVQPRQVDRNQLGRW